MQSYLEKIKTLHKDTSSYHSKTNKKVKHLNDIIGIMLGKMLLNKLTKLWNLYLDQAIFAYGIRTHSTTKTSLFYLLYNRQLHLLSDPNTALSTDKHGFRSNSSSGFRVFNRKFRVRSSSITNNSNSIEFELFSLLFNRVRA